MNSFPQTETAGSLFPAEVTLLAGTTCPVRESWEPFAPQAVDFLETFSRALRQNSLAKEEPETMALAFWCRRAHILSLREKHGMGPADRHGVRPEPAIISDGGKERLAAKEGSNLSRGQLYLGWGRIFHLAPSNVPMMFAYTWIIGLLAGNAGIVRISERTLRQEPVQAVLEVLRDLLGQEQQGPLRRDFSGIRARTSFITYDHSEAVTEQILQHCDGRVLWGGDETIRRMRRIPMPAHAVELTFPDRVSLAVISEEALTGMEEAQIRNLVHRFYNDTYVMDQNGCSSPQTVVWLRGNKGTGKGQGENKPAAEQSRLIREKWWDMLAEEAENVYGMDGFRAARKLEKATLSAMQQTDSMTIRIRRYHGNLLYVLSLSDMPDNLAVYKGGFGLFFEMEAGTAAEIFKSFTPRIQTVVCIGVEPGILAGLAAQHHSEGVLRFVESGQALQIDTIWDGIDLIRALSRKIL